MATQKIIFKKLFWTKQHAEEFLIRNNYKIDKLCETELLLKYTQFYMDNLHFDYILYRITPSITYIYEEPKKKSDHL